MKFSHYLAIASFCFATPAVAQTTPPAFLINQAPAMLEPQFQTPPRAAKPWTFWMWLGVDAPDEAITRDLREMHDKGIAGVIIYGGSLGPVWYPDSKVVLEGKEYRKVKTDEYGGKSDAAPFARMQPWSDRWRASIRHASAEANRLGIDLCLSIGPTALREFVGDEYGQQSLEWSQDTFNGPGVYDATLPLPKIKMSAAAEAKLSGAPYHRDVALLAMPDKPVVKPDEIVDLTSKMDASGHVKWNAPVGNWKIVRFTQVATRKGNSFTLFVDGLSSQALDKSWQSTMGRLLPEMSPNERAGLKYIEEDSWEAGEPNWTKNFPAEFKKRRGYDLMNYLPVLMGATVGDKDTTARVMRDYQLTISDLIADNHYAYKRKLANAAGFPLVAEAAGPNMKQSDLLKNSSRVDVAMAEFWAPSPHRPTPERRFLVRNAASANHIYGKPVTMSEGFTSVGPHWEESPLSLKATGDQAFCDGLNRVTFHTAALSPSMTAKPGYTFWAGTHYEPGITWWNQTPAFNTYLARCSAMLQQGLFVADALLYKGDSSGFNVAMKTVVPTLGEGYDSDDCNTEVLLSRLSFKNGRLMLPDGMNYGVLVLSENQPMRLDALEKIAALLRAGAKVVGPRPTAMFGMPLHAGDDAKFNNLVRQLWGDGTGLSKRIGRGELAWGKTARQMLAESKVQPDFQYSGLSPAGTLDWIHRRANNGSEIYFVTSRWATPEKIEASFRVTGKQPELWDAVTGKTRPATAFRQANGRTIVPLQFDPSGSTFVVFRRSIAATAQGTTATNYPTLTPQMTLSGPWDVSFYPKWGGPANVRFNELTYWTKRPEDGIKFYSGTATYRKTFDVASVPMGRKVWLDLGEVHEVAEVRLNGNNLGVVWTKPARVDVTDAIKTGANNLEVDVVNLWPNRLIGDAALPPEKRFTETNMRKFTAKSPLLPSGLLGPVRLLDAR